MSAEENKAIVRRAWEAVWHSDPGARQYFASDYILRDALAEPGYSLDGMLGLVPMWKSAAPDMIVTIDDIMAEGDYVTSRMVWRGTHQGDFPWGPHPPYKPSGKPVTFGEILISRVAGGKIAEEWFAIDFTDVWRQFGALPA